MPHCKQCQNTFEVAPEDRAFYEKMKVPEPVLCFDCRMRWRMAFRNERNLYKRKCDLSGRDIVSVLPPTSPFRVYEQSEWWSDKWDALDYGRDFDFNRSFFEQFYELMLEVPRMSLNNRNNENSEYCNDSNDMKNCYLCFNCEHGENYYYSNTVGYGRDSIDLFWCLETELCYECIKTHGSYRCFWCFNSKGLSDCYFCEDSLGCKNCFGCIGLRQKEYCIYNEQKTKEAFEAFMNDFHFTYPGIEDVKKKVAALRLKLPHRNLEQFNSEDCVGDFISDSRNCRECFDVMNSENSKYVWDGIVNNCMDCYNAGIDSNYLYDSIGVYKSNNVRFCHKCGNGSADLTYCDSCGASENCFGCISLVRKKYCILNKQYSKEEYEKLVPKIIEHMKSTGEWGGFFSPKLSPFGYNDSMAVEYFPLTREEALEKGFIWNDYVRPKVEGAKVIAAAKLPDSIADVPDGILEWAIECEGCNKPYKVVRQELKFYRDQGLPVPHKCPDCRHYARKGRINPRVLYDRKCDKCQADIQSTYSPDRPEIIYCESCYLKEVY